MLLKYLLAVFVAAFAVVSAKPGTESELPYHTTDATFQFNYVVQEILSSGIVTHEATAELERVIETSPECMYCHLVLGYVYARAGNLQKAYGNHVRALNLFPAHDAAVAFLDDHAICVRKEDILYNLAYLLFKLGAAAHEDAVEYIREAQRIADAAFRFTRNKVLHRIERDDGLPESYSPRSVVYERFLGDHGVNFSMRAPMLRAITLDATLANRLSSIPWTIHDDYELGDPLSCAPEEHTRRRDRVGSYRFGQRRINTNEFC
jgi:tetratricopeptide (TPR) repeat protein